MDYLEIIRQVEEAYERHTPSAVSKDLAAKCQAASGPGPSHIVVQLAASNARPVYWEGENGQIRGPAVPEFLARVGIGEMARFLVLVQYEGRILFVDSDLLRSRKARPLREPHVG